MPTSTPKPTAPTRLRVYRYASGVVILLLGAAATLLPNHATWLVPLTTAASVAAGKYFGIGTTDTTRLALQLMAPEKAAEVAVSALASLPPREAEKVTTQLLASLPPEARERVSLLPPAPAAPGITFIGGTEPPPSVAK